MTEQTQGLADELEEAIEVHEGHCVSYVDLPSDLGRRILVALRQHDRMRDALDDCRVIIQYHCKPEKCVRKGDRVISALAAYDNALAALNQEQPHD